MQAKSRSNQFEHPGTERNIYVVAATTPPYSVYGCTFGTGNGVGAVLSVADNGTLSSVSQLLKYGATAGVHGQAISADHRFLYSADDTGNTLWTHAIEANGTLTNVGKLAGPSTKSDPRHVAVHPAGQYLYVVLEGSNQVAAYSIEKSTGLPTLVNPLYPLLPDGEFKTLGSDYYSFIFSVSSARLTAVPPTRSNQ